MIVGIEHRDHCSRSLRRDRHVTRFEYLCFKQLITVVEFIRMLTIILDGDPVNAICAGGVHRRRGRKCMDLVGCRHKRAAERHFTVQQTTADFTAFSWQQAHTRLGHRQDWRRDARLLAGDRRMRATSHESTVSRIRRLFAFANKPPLERNDDWLLQTILGRLDDE